MLLLDHQGSTETKQTKPHKAVTLNNNDILSYYLKKGLFRGRAWHYASDEMKSN